MSDLVETTGAVLAVVVATFAVVGMLFKWVMLPNLREQLLRPVEETRRQVSDNKHANRKPTIIDRLDDVEQTLEAIGTNQTALMKQIGEHVRESSLDRGRLWLVIEAIVHQEQQEHLTGRSRHVKERGDTGG